MNQNSQDKMRKVLNNFEAQLDLGFFMPPFGKVVKTKDLNPILAELKELISIMESGNSSISLITEEKKDKINN